MPWMTSNVEEQESNLCWSQTARVRLFHHSVLGSEYRDRLDIAGSNERKGARTVDS